MDRSDEFLISWKSRYLPGELIKTRWQNVASSFKQKSIKNIFGCFNNCLPTTQLQNEGSSPSETFTSEFRSYGENCDCMLYNEYRVFILSSLLSIFLHISTRFSSLPVSVKRGSGWTFHNLLMIRTFRSLNAQFFHNYFLRFFRGEIWKANDLKIFFLSAPNQPSTSGRGMCWWRRVRRQKKL